MATETPAQALSALEKFFGGRTTLTRGGKEPGNTGGDGIEPGIDVVLPQGSAVRTPFAGVFRQDLSTSQEAVVQFTTASGKPAYEAFTHVNYLDFLKTDPYLSAGQEVGTVASDGYHYDKGITYYSDAPSIEYAVGEGITSPGQLVSYSHTEDIGSLLAGVPTGTASGATASGPISSTGGSGGTIVQPPSTDTGSNTGFNPTLPSFPSLFGKGGLIDPSNWISGNVPTVAGVTAIVIIVLVLVVLIKR